MDKWPSGFSKFQPQDGKLYLGQIRNSKINYGLTKSSSSSVEKETVVVDIGSSKPGISSDNNHPEDKSGNFTRLPSDLSNYETSNNLMQKLPYIPESRKSLDQFSDCIGVEYKLKLGRRLVEITRDHPCYDPLRSNRCSQIYFGNRCNIVMCQRDHTLPKIDGVHCYYYLNGYCKKSSHDCCFLHCKHYLSTYSGDAGIKRISDLDYKGCEVTSKDNTFVKIHKDTYEMKTTTSDYIKDYQSSLKPKQNKKSSSKPRNTHDTCSPSKRSEISASGNKETCEDEGNEADANTEIIHDLLLEIFQTCDKKLDWKKNVQLILECLKKRLEDYIQERRKEATNNSDQITIKMKNEIHQCIKALTDTHLEDEVNRNMVPNVKNEPYNNFASDDSGENVCQSASLLICTDSDENKLKVENEKCKNNEESFACTKTFENESRNTSTSDATIAKRCNESRNTSTSDATVANKCNNYYETHLVLSETVKNGSSNVSSLKSGETDENKTILSSSTFRDPVNRTSTKSSLSQSVNFKDENNPVGQSAKESKDISSVDQVVICSTSDISKVQLVVEMKKDLKDKEAKYRDMKKKKREHLKDMQDVIDGREVKKRKKECARNVENFEREIKGKEHIKHGKTKKITKDRKQTMKTEGGKTEKSKQERHKGVLSRKVTNDEGSTAVKEKRKENVKQVTDKEVNKRKKDHLIDDQDRILKRRKKEVTRYAQEREREIKKSKSHAKDNQPKEVTDDRDRKNEKSKHNKDKELTVNKVVNNEQINITVKEIRQEQVKNKKKEQAKDRDGKIKNKEDIQDQEVCKEKKGESQNEVKSSKKEHARQKPTSKNEVKRRKKEHPKYERSKEKQIKRNKDEQTKKALMDEARDEKEPVGVIKQTKKAEDEKEPVGVIEQTKKALMDEARDEKEPVGVIEQTKKALMDEARDEKEPVGVIEQIKEILKAVKLKKEEDTKDKQVSKDEVIGQKEDDETIASISAYLRRFDREISAYISCEYSLEAPNSHPQSNSEDSTLIQTVSKNNSLLQNVLKPLIGKSSKSDTNMSRLSLQNEGHWYKNEQFKIEIPPTSSSSFSITPPTSIFKQEKTDVYNPSLKVGSNFYNTLATIDLDELSPNQDIYQEDVNKGDTRNGPESSQAKNRSESNQEYTNNMSKNSRKEEMEYDQESSVDDKLNGSLISHNEKGVKFNSKDSNSNKKEAEETDSESSQEVKNTASLMTQEVEMTALENCQDADSNDRQNDSERDQGEIEAYEIILATDLIQRYLKYPNPHSNVFENFAELGKRFRVNNFELNMNNELDVLNRNIRRLIVMLVCVANDFDYCDNNDDSDLKLDEPLEEFAENCWRILNLL